MLNVQLEIFVPLCHSKLSVEVALSRCETETSLTWDYCCWSHDDDRYKSESV